jgi:hypothetical protein
MQGRSFDRAGQVAASDWIGKAELIAAGPDYFAGWHDLDIDQESHQTGSRDCSFYAYILAN